MASVSSPYGLIPIGLMGGQSYVGSTREVKLSTNNSAAIFAGDVIQLTAAGNPQSLAATPTAGTTAGIIGVCTGVRYVTATNPQPFWAQYLPANSISGGMTSVYIEVCDDPDVIMKIQGSAAFGTLTNGADGARGKNAALGNFGGSTVTGNSTVNLVVGANGGSLANTATLAMRIVGVMPGTETDSFPDILVKWNLGTHSYMLATGV